MRRAHAHSLVMINWRGVFFEHYALDRHVTALEGSNGAGKTTVMIAAYLVLMPDQRYLKFTNLGESEAIGGDRGIWGRLGPGHRPAYSAIGFTLPDGQSIIAGVRIEQASEPNFELTPFILSTIPSHLTPRELMLLQGQQKEAIATGPELRDHVATFGVQYNEYRNLKAYFKALFDFGITPMSMKDDRDRKKFNEMLKTSMTGGMSRGLLSDLRFFLFKQEGILAERITKMRENIKQCHRARTSLEASQHNRKHINAVYTHTEQMLAMGVQAVYMRSIEASRRISDLDAKIRTAEVAVQLANEQLQSCQQDLEQLEALQTKQHTRQEHLKHELHQTQDALDRLASYQHQSQNLAQCQATLDQHIQTLKRAKAKLDDCLTRRKRAEQEHVQALHNLRDLEAALRDFDRRAHRYRRIIAQRKQARGALNMPSLDVNTEPAPFEQHLTQCNQRRRTIQRQLDDATHHRQHHGLAYQALMAITEHLQPKPATPFEQSQWIIQQAIHLKTLGQSLGQLTQTHRQLTQDMMHAEASRKVADRLNLQTSEDVNQAQRDTEQKLEALRRKWHDTSNQIAQLEQQQVTIEQQVSALEQHQKVILNAQPVLERLKSDSGQPLDTKDAFARYKKRLARQTIEVESHIGQTRSEIEALQKQLNQPWGRAYPESLVELSEHLGGNLIGELFDDLSIDRAPTIEAGLGPWKDAIVVDDVESVSPDVISQRHHLETIYLVDDLKALQTHPSTSTPGGDVVVDWGKGLRQITRLPKYPIFGQAARQAHLTHLRERLAEARSQLSQYQQKQQTLYAFEHDVQYLESVEHIWIQGSQHEHLRTLKQNERKLRQQLSTAHASIRQLNAQRELTKQRQRELINLLPHARLLDDYPQRKKHLEQLTRQCERAQQAQSISRDIAADLKILTTNQLALKYQPLTPDQEQSMREELIVLNQRHTQWTEGLEALLYIRQHADDLQWADAEQVHLEKQTFASQLETHLDKLQQRVDQVRAETEEAERKHTDCVQGHAQAAAQFETQQNTTKTALQKLKDAPVKGATPELISQIQQQLHTLSESIRAAREQERALGMMMGQRKAQLQNAQAELERLMTARESEYNQAMPAIERWETLEALVEKEGLASRLFVRQQEQSQSAIQCQIDAKAASQVLVAQFEHLEQYDIIEAIEPFLRADEYIKAWPTIRHWLYRRLPAEIAQQEQPLQALALFDEHVERLSRKLEVAEQELQRQSTGIAQNISSSIRNAYTRIKRLNQNLKNTRFGSIEAIQVKFSRVSYMMDVLDALGRESDQRQLFDPTMPVEQALDALFQKYGQGRTAGQQLLDYRYYIELTVQVKRTPKGQWEQTNPTKLSTGEAIGVGAALMMVVLTEWEDAAKLFKKHQRSCLRFLFLDEANRLDKHNLAAIFDLCDKLDLQLMVAAPEVAQAGGCTVYTLVRQRIDDHEVVVKTGRRYPLTPDA